MKTQTIILSAFIILINTSCDQFDKLTHFNMEYNQTILIPGATDIDLPFDTKTPDIETNSESTFSGKDTNKDLIEEVILEQSLLTINTPVDGDLSFLKSITIYMNADNLEEIKVMWQDTIPENIGDSLDLKTSDADLKAYIMKDSFSLRVNTVIRKIINSDYEMNLYTNFDVDAKILGQ